MGILRKEKIPNIFQFLVMDHKYKALLQNIPTRHVITAIAPVAGREEQIEKLRNLDINNFFILGSLDAIKGVLGNVAALIFFLPIKDNSFFLPRSESAKREYFERNFAWHAITQYNGDLSCNCENATIMFLRPISDAKYRDRLGLMKSMYNLKKEPEVTSVFYFDLALRSFLAVKYERFKFVVLSVVVQRFYPSGICYKVELGQQIQSM